MKYIPLFILTLLLTSHALSAQVTTGRELPSSLDSLKREVLLLRTEVKQVKLNLAKSKRKFKAGILVASLGYSITITGGLMLGRKHDDVGKALLIAGGATGLTGTILMVDAFSSLTDE